MTKSNLTMSTQGKNMNRFFRRMLLCSLLAPLLPACGVEFEQGVRSDNSAESDQAAADQAAVKQSHGDEPTNTEEPVEIIFAKDALEEHALLAPVEPLALILIDRTGSMREVRPSTNNTRCLDAVTQAEAQVDELVGKGAKSFAVWTFSGNTVVQRITYVSRDTALAVIDSLRTEQCDGNTPLAFAMCAAAENLGKTRLNPGNVAFLSVSTDGGENSSSNAPPLSTGNTNCSGPDGAVTTANTWPNKVTDYITKTIGNIKVDDTYWLSPGLGSFAGSADLSSATTACSTPKQCDEALFSSLSNTTGGNFRKAADNQTNYPCINASACPVPDSGNVGNRFAFTAVNTNNATANTVNYSVFLFAGETITAGTCGVPGSSGSGDTVLRMFTPSGTQVAVNDDSCGILSKIAFAATADGTYMISAGCFSTNSCSGTVAFAIEGSFTFSASNTNSATANTVNRNVYLRPSQNILLGTCGVVGASGIGDSFLRLFDHSGSNVALNDDSCRGLSKLSYNVPPNGAGTHQIRAGCFSNGSCSGTVAYLITQP